MPDLLVIPMEVVVEIKLRYASIRIYTYVYSFVNIVRGMFGTCMLALLRDAIAG
jgi:hypothetical protein